MPRALFFPAADDGNPDSWQVQAGEYADEPDLVIVIEHAVSSEGKDRRESVAREVAALLNSRDALAAEVERLTAIVHAKESWIDGAKVDLDAFDEQTLTLTASVAAHASALEREKAKVAFLSREIHDWSHRADALAERIRKVEALPILTVECGDGALRDYVSARDFRAALATTEAGEGS